MENVTRTIYGSRLQSSLLLRIPFVAQPFTTLNEKLGIQAGVVTAPGAYPASQYFAVGNGGHTVTAGSDGIALTKMYQHKATDAALFNQMPFILREPGNDISPGERAKYALRKEVIVGGVTYVAYYLRRIAMIEVTTETELRNVNAGVVTTAPFTPTASNLAPTPVTPSSSGVNVLAGDYVTCTSQISVGFTAAEVEEYLNAAEILYGSRDYGIISEIALCSGADKVISVAAPTGVFNFSEAIQVQVMTFIADLHVMRYTASGLEKILDVGSNSPLYSLV
jgi:hypothetical protein